MRIWVNNNTEERFISHSDSSAYLSSGWNRGRIPSHRPPVRVRTKPEKIYKMRSPSGTILDIPRSIYVMKKSRMKESGWKFTRKPRSTEFKQNLSIRMSNSVWMASPDGRKRINIASRDKYLSRGWNLGMRYTSSSSAEYEFTISDFNSPDMKIKLSFLRNDVDENQGLHYRI